ncbi:hypothetical protein HY643_00640 [Candidatus Woesearchaeota archaeon]|nr:hypothetical protein [Candidatus Woesearchaeota archaeon]
MNSTKALKYQLVSIDTMHTQVNVRFPEKLLSSAKSYAEENGFGTLQDFIKETVREKLFEKEGLTKNELQLVKKLVQVNKKNNLYNTEAQLFKKLRKK